ncbi:MAG: phosphatidate cytidylyltransferase [Bacteroidetes bacterium]|nr:MAG: phosphatidate cytidylyltransferase [Bacteroidota bacterium]
MNVLVLLGMSVAFLSLFAISEWLYVKGKVAVEITRKISHIGTGILTLAFPVVLTNHWEVLILCSSFLILLVLSIRFEFLKGINNVERTTYGSVLYPVAVYLVYLVYAETGNLGHFYAPILILAISDPVAALVGRRWPLIPFSVAGETKTVAGSVAFSLSAFFITGIIWMMESEPLSVQSIFTVLAIALISALTEAVSRKGWDNLSIPLSVLLVIWMGS